MAIVAGSDVVANASSYKAPPQPSSIHQMNHVIFRRAGEAELPAPLPITGQVIQLQLPPHLEDISSTRIGDLPGLFKGEGAVVQPPQGYKAVDVGQGGRPVVEGQAVLPGGLLGEEEQLAVAEYEISKYIPQYLGEAALYLHPSELDEQVLWLKSLLGSPNDSAVAGALNTIAVLLQVGGGGKTMGVQPPFHLIPEQLHSGYLDNPPQAL